MYILKEVYNHIVEVGRKIFNSPYSIDDVYTKVAELGKQSKELDRKFNEAVDARKALRKAIDDGTVTQQQTIEALEVQTQLMEMQKDIFDIQVHSSDAFLKFGDWQENAKVPINCLFRWEGTRERCMMSSVTSRYYQSVLLEMYQDADSTKAVLQHLTDLFYFQFGLMELNIEMRPFEAFASQQHACNEDRQRLIDTYQKFIEIQQGLMTSEEEY
jgi:hypothetical protein